MATYHLQLRHYPRACTRFNQTGQQVGAVVLPWVQEKVFELDGEKWAPYDSTITIIEGPEIAVERLSMGRGWATAQREGSNVTERVLEEARQAIADGSAHGQSGGEAGHPASSPPRSAAPPEPSRDYPSLARREQSALPSTAEQADSVPASLEALLGPDSAQLAAAWRAVCARTAGLAPSESLALAERELQRGAEGER